VRRTWLAVGTLLLLGGAAGVWHGLGRVGPARAAPAAVALTMLAASAGLVLVLWHGAQLRAGGRRRRWHEAVDDLRSVLDGEVRRPEDGSPRLILEGRLGERSARLEESRRVYSRSQRATVWAEWVTFRVEAPGVPFVQVARRSRWRRLPAALGVGSAERVTGDVRVDARHAFTTTAEGAEVLRGRRAALRPALRRACGEAGFRRVDRLGGALVGARWRRRSDSQPGRLEACFAALAGLAAVLRDPAAAPGTPRARGEDARPDDVAEDGPGEPVRDADAAAAEDPAPPPTGPVVLRAPEP